MKKSISVLILTLCLMVIALNAAPAQAAFSAGDGAFLGFNVDGDDDLAFVFFRDIQNGEYIYFTDDEWNGTAFEDVNEGTLLWTNDTGATISAGTVLILTDVDNDANASFGASVGSLTMDETTFNMSGAGDIVYAYSGTRGVPEFIAAFTNDPVGFEESPATLTNTGLTEGSTAINLSAFSDTNGTGTSPDGGEYIGPRNFANFNEYLTAINTASNWEFEETDGELLLPLDGSSVTLTEEKQCGLAATQTYGFSDLSPSTPISITIDTLGTIDCITVVPVDGNHPNATTGIQTGRYWTVSAVDVGDATATGFSVTMTLLDGSADVDTRICKYPGGLGGAGWDCDTGANTSFVASTSVTRSAITGFSDWAVGQDVTPTAVSLQSVSTAVQTGAPIIFATILLGLVVMTLVVTRQYRKQN